MARRRGKVVKATGFESIEAFKARGGQVTLVESGPEPKWHTNPVINPHIICRFVPRNERKPAGEW